MRRGLVIGKFLPPHRGHRRLIERAREEVDHLTVVVCDRPDQEIPGTLRAAWLQEIHPDTEVRVVPDICRDDDSQAWADYTREFLGGAPDVVFTSEAYGDVYARCLGCRHVCLDPARREVPVSGTRVREDPLGCWEYLEACVRAHFAVRVCIAGAESTGTTTLARDLAEALRTAWAPEYGRTYCEGKYSGPGRDRWQTSEFLHIAEAQNALEDALARRCNRVLVCDTNSFITCFWHERYIGCWSAAVEALSAGRRTDLYLLTSPGIPFVQDGLRDGESIRRRMHRRMRRVLTERGLPFRLAAGSPQVRLQRALSLVGELTGHRIRPWTESGAPAAAA